jgi:hypothetical protein
MLHKFNMYSGKIMTDIIGGNKTKKIFVEMKKGQWFITSHCPF